MHVCDLTRDVLRHLDHRGMIPKRPCGWSCLAANEVSKISGEGKSFQTTAEFLGLLKEG